jgi:tRNA modification GTPase
MYTLDDTIAAIATPTGIGGIGIVRLSGPDAHRILHSLFVPVGEDGKGRHRRLVYGHILDPVSSHVVDEVLATAMAAPRTYTRQDMAEIQAHGGMAPLRAILELCLAHGARLAEPGEFTLRAFVSGRIDLSQAEAVMDVVRAKTDRALEAAVGQLQGALSQRVRHIRGKLLDALAHLQAQMDFCEDEIPEFDLVQDLSRAAGELSRLVEEAAKGIILREGLRVAIVGKPNAGKSSLLNRLLRADRALVTPIPGTTRDTLEETLDIHGFPVVLVDTAGIAEPRDPIEALGIERSLRSLDSADLALWVTDGSSPVTEEDRRIAGHLERRDTLVIVNKVDLPQASNPERLLSEAPYVRVSCLTGEGIDQLEQQIADAVLQGELSVSERGSVIHTRHRALFAASLSVVERTRHALMEGLTPDLVAVDLQEVIHLLGQVTGDTASEELLDTIFGQFCIGK